MIWADSLPSEKSGLFNATDQAGAGFYEYSCQEKEMYNRLLVGCGRGWQALWIQKDRRP